MLLNKKLSSALIPTIFLVLACTQNVLHKQINQAEKDSIQNNTAVQKIKFNLNEFDEHGLYGLSDGLRSLNYEFCIPGEENKLNSVKIIDTTIIVYRNSAGRIGCSKGQFLCIGNTHQDKFKSVLMKLAGLKYVKKIVPVYYE